eukprot:CAMPEP_0170553022 /NCGR_PEP_ID=MMETSP0211-20121228/10901_1 /TAXON_ID=311385 /ORGANISM="Pseudokeronopsis sp., Strain OXSARD2" /LENGTH=58 /DNA_ID=CAMNT_0010861139 /DNA_START=410 /DNA_END=583 /DNA_ORIENTATION=+
MGDNVTWLDFYNLDFYEFLNWLTNGEFYSKNPRTETYAKRVAELPGVKEYRASDKFIS